MVKIKYEATEPSEIETTMTITMTLKNWLDLREQLSNNFPSWKFGQEITQMILDANKHFYLRSKDEPK